MARPAFNARLGRNSQSGNRTEMIPSSKHWPEEAEPIGVAPLGCTSVGPLGLGSQSTFLQPSHPETTAESAPLPFCRSLLSVVRRGCPFHRGGDEPRQC